MVWIRAIYRCPKSRTEILIYDDNSLTTLEDRKILEQSKTKTVSLEHIRHLIGRSNTTKHLQWTIKLVPASDFLSALNSHKREKVGVSNQSFRNLESLELLTMCLQKPPHLSGSLNTPKILDEIPDEDVIEVFI